MPPLHEKILRVQLVEQEEGLEPSLRVIHLPAFAFTSPSMSSSEEQFWYRIRCYYAATAADADADDDDDDGNHVLNINDRNRPSTLTADR